MFFQRQSGPCAATGGAFQSDRRGSRDSRARPSNAADHRRGSDGQHIVSCPPPVARHLEPIGEARARPSGFSPRPTGDRRGSATGRVADLRQSLDERRGCADTGPSRPRPGTGKIDPKRPFRVAISNAGPCPVPDFRTTRSGGPHEPANLIFFAAIRAIMPLTRVGPRSR